MVKNKAWKQKGKATREDTEEEKNRTRKRIKANE